jgi:hypothetical protein
MITSTRSISSILRFDDPNAEYDMIIQKGHKGAQELLIGAGIPADILAEWVRQSDEGKKGLKLTILMRSGCTHRHRTHDLTRAACLSYTCADSLLVCCFLVISHGGLSGLFISGNP